MSADGPCTDCAPMNTTVVAGSALASSPRTVTVICSPVDASAESITTSTPPSIADMPSASIAHIA